MSNESNPGGANPDPNATNPPAAGTAAPPAPPAPPADAPKAPPGPIKVGDVVDLLHLVGGPAIRRVPARVTAVAKVPPKGRPAGQYLTLAAKLIHDGPVVTFPDVGPEPAEGASLNVGGGVFPCWARTNAT